MSKNKLINTSNRLNSSNYTGSLYFKLPSKFSEKTGIKYSDIFSIKNKENRFIESICFITTLLLVTELRKNVLRKEDGL